MTREEFIEVLEEKGYSYEMEGDKVVVTGMNPSTAKHKHWSEREHVDLNSLETLPPGVEFRNEGAVSLDSLETLPPDVKFNNRGRVFLKGVETIPPGVVFNNKGYDVDFGSLVGVYFSHWTGNIEGIDSKRLLTGMIKRGIFL